jgi:hypothetical protein
MCEYAFRTTQKFPDEKKKQTENKNITHKKNNNPKTKIFTTFFYSLYENEQKLCRIEPKQDFILFLLPFFVCAQKCSSG